MDNFDLMNTLKWKELAEVEEYLDLPMDEWTESKSKSKLIFVMQYMMAKRNNPSLTIGEAEEMSIQQLTELAGVEFTVPKEVNPA
ncbi:hypothetical protein UFOVP542_3 [uncultured Caudovirales phage]|uniref:Uncharacterized protein n=1 Tax=uncultured Caudovirales phage TaxID=2100421 RepID=A0A6J5MSK1_9CAUD|nr:hypothetical protein UFOVP542_3 [uncultured Caudovirales phage]